MVSPPKRLTGVLCIPLPSQALSEAEIAELEALKTWARSAAVDAGIELAAIEGAFDSAEDIVARIFRRIQEADIIVSIIHHGSPNVMFESGYAIGLGKTDPPPSKGDRLDSL
jgi:nucleoside 2-deoxyribosyltransferase